MNEAEVAAGDLDDRGDPWRSVESAHQGWAQAVVSAGFERMQDNPMAPL